MPSKNKMLTPIRFYADDYEKIKEKCFSDTISFQKLMEILAIAYMKDNPEIRKIVEKYLSDRKQNKNNILDEDEVVDVYRLLEENSPLNHGDKND